MSSSQQQYQYQVQEQEEAYVEKLKDVADLEYLWQILEENKKDKKQIAGYLKLCGDSFCIDGFIIHTLLPDMNIDGSAWAPVGRFTEVYDEFSNIDGGESALYSIDGLVRTVKENYKRTHKLNLKMLATINDRSIENGNPYTFDQFIELFKEIGVKVDVSKSKRKPKDEVKRYH